MDTAAGFPDSVFALTGEPAAIDDSGSTWSTFARTATEASDDLRNLDAATFIGDEADLYRTRINTNLPPYLDTTADAWHRVAAAVTTYSRTLDELQTELTALRNTAHQQWRDAATAAADRAAHHRPDADRAAADPAGHQPTDADRTAADAADAATAQFQATLDRAATIRARHDHAVNTCVAGIDAARNLRFADPPGWLSRLWQSACDWVADHVDILQTLSAVLKQISGIAAMLTFIPVIGPLAGAVAVTTGGLAVGIDATIKLATGEGDWAQISIDALSMIPGARAAKAVIIADTTNTAVHVATGDITITDATFALATNAGMARLGGARPGTASTPQTTQRPGTATDFRSAPMGRPAPPERPMRDQLQARQTPPPVGYTPTGFEIRHSTTATAIGSDAHTMINFNRSRGRDGLHDVIVHGTPHGDFALHPATDDFIHPALVADIIRANPHYRPGQDIRLVTCFGAARPRSRGVADGARNGTEVTSYAQPGSPSLAQEVADLMGCNVYAGSSFVDLDSVNGELRDFIYGVGISRPELGQPAARPRRGWS